MKTLAAVLVETSQSLQIEELQIPALKEGGMVVRSLLTSSEKILINLS